jgi:hypothetical protein
MLNRAVLIVRPKRPFLDCAVRLDDSGLVPEVSGEQFERELFGWHTDQSAWPKSRTLVIFRQWFEVALDSVVEDLCAYEIVDDEA